MRHSLTSFCIHPIRDFIYPRVCSICDTLLDEKDDRLCTRCLESFVEIHNDHPVWIEIRSKLVGEGVVDDFLSCFLFEKEGKLQEAIHLLKYRGMKAVGVMLGKEIGRRIAGDPAFGAATLLLPVPLHTLKQRERGYNQSEFLCRGISDVTGIPVAPTILKREKYTESQTQLTLIERRENVGDAFRVQRRQQSLIEGATIILVDDVITTGATINACAQRLREHGAASVLAASVALAQ